MKTKSKTTEEKINSQTWKPFGFQKKGMLGKCVSNNQANIRIGKGKKKKNKRNQKERMFFKKGLMDKNKEKMEFWKGRQKQNKKKKKTE